MMKSRPEIVSDMMTDILKIVEGGSRPDLLIMACVCQAAMGAGIGEEISGMVGRTLASHYSQEELDVIKEALDVVREALDL